MINERSALGSRHVGAPSQPIEVGMPTCRRYSPSSLERRRVGTIPRLYPLALERRRRRVGAGAAYTVEPVLGDLWFGRPLALGDHNHWHGSFLTIKYLA